MNLLGSKIISLTGNSMYSTMVTYRKYSLLSEVYHKDQFSVQHCNCLRHSSIIKYADDAVIYVSGNDLESIQKKLNVDVHNRQ